MNDYDAHSSIVRWIHDLTGLMTIKSHQGGKAPQLPYIMVNMLGMEELFQHPRRIEYDVQSSDIMFNEHNLMFGEYRLIFEGNGRDNSQPIMARPLIEVEWHFSVHSYGDMPTGLLRPILTASKISQALEPAFPELVINRVSQIRNVPDWVNERWQSRGQLDIYVRGIINDGHIIDTIDKYSIDYDGYK